MPIGYATGFDSDVTVIGSGLCARSGAAGERKADQRSTLRIDSDMLGAGTLANRTMTTGGTSDSAATTVHPARELVPET